MCCNCVLLAVTGEFATQTCFQGRFGEEMGSDEFGGAIMMHAPEPDKQWVVGRMSHIEVTHAGAEAIIIIYDTNFKTFIDTSPVTVSVFVTY